MNTNEARTMLWHSFMSLSIPFTIYSLPKNAETTEK